MCVGDELLLAGLAVPVPGGKPVDDGLGAAFLDGLLIGLAGVLLTYLAGLVLPEGVEGFSHFMSSIAIAQRKSHAGIIGSVTG